MNLSYNDVKCGKTLNAMKGQCMQMIFLLNLLARRRFALIGEKMHNKFYSNHKPSQMMVNCKTWNLDFIMTSNAEKHLMR